MYFKDCHKVYVYSITYVQCALPHRKILGPCKIESHKGHQCLGACIAACAHFKKLCTELYSREVCTVRRKFLTGENIDEFDEFPAIRNIFPIKIFHLVSYSMLMIGIRQFFTHQNFPNPDSSKFSTVKILRHTVASW